MSALSFRSHPSFGMRRLGDYYASFPDGDSMQVRGKSRAGIAVILSRWLLLPTRKRFIYTVPGCGWWSVLRASLSPPLPSPHIQGLLDVLCFASKSRGDDEAKLSSLLIGLIRRWGGDGAALQRRECAALPPLLIHGRGPVCLRPTPVMLNAPPGSPPFDPFCCTLTSAL